MQNRLRELSIAIEDALLEGSHLSLKPVVGHLQSMARP